MKQKSRHVRPPGRLLAIAASAALLGGNAFAGGYIVKGSVTGTPATWSTAGPITVNLDQGSLGSLSNAQADALTMSALDLWSTSSIAGSALTFTQGADLSVDHTGGNIPEWNVTGDGISPVIYDNDGSVTNQLLGAGANQSVVGFAGIEDISGLTITEGHAVLNGLFINGTSGPSDPADLSAAIFEGVIAHEFGHMLNLDHAAANTSRALHPGPQAVDFTGFPTMFPLVHGGIATLAKDDEVWICELYPATGYASTVSSFTGTINNSAGTATNGFNVVARRISNPAAEVITCVSGFNSGSSSADGQFKIPGLTPGEAYVLDIEQIEDSFVGGSRVGGLGAQLDFAVVGLPEFINNAAVEGNSDTLGHSTAFIAPGGGTTTTNVNGRMNGAPAITTVNEATDAGEVFPDSMNISSNVTSNLNTIIRITGTMDDAADAGNLDFGTGDVDDWYRIDPAFPIEVFDVKLSPTGFTGDLFIISWDAGGLGGLTGAAVTGIGSGSSGSVDRHYNPDRFGSGSALGIMYIGVGGNGNGTYNLDIMASYADAPDGSAVYVSGTQGDFDPTTGVVTVKGNNFSSSGGAPSVAFSDANIIVNNVTFNDAQTLTVSTSVTGGFTPGTSDITVTNQAAAGGFSGSVLGVTTLPVKLDVFLLD